ncbi:unnamed protein product [Ceutorhynchus assimilis]|uniref:Integrin beta n=1 Tax=Ceutorhynchus assimilis TaxID=467358 RepID=A0A9P0DRF9_9CUCU|nr:unnamed protein product [Ceutorhynchus assimilis]
MFQKMNIFVWVFVISIKFCAAQDCESKAHCDECIQELGCFWCTKAPNGTHCLLESESILCDVKKSENPRYSFSIVNERPLTETEQINPQKVVLRLRRNEKFEIDFRYRQSENYPVDLYYLMDLSFSMLQSKNRLAELGGKLADEMKRKTNDFRIGFGSFVDKRALPYVNTHPNALLSPCKGCAPPYSFKNHLSLMTDAALFSRRVRETQISGNLDTPEGGLDAIMQAIVCKEVIGWRQNARHLLVMSTDAVSHIAGDGKLGGVVEPNDARCHLINDTYTDEHALVYDYPSVSQINYVARENNINLIFASVLKTKADRDHLKNHYQAMSGAIENSKTGTLDVDSDNVVNLISDIYDQIRDSVKITSDAQKDVNVNITSSCPNYLDGRCYNVELGQTIDFKATIEPLVCHKNAESNKRTIRIKPEGLEDSLVIELEVSCECSCAADKLPLAEECNSEGDLECGTCRCREGRLGDRCQCDRNESKGEDPSLCVKPHGAKNEECSGQGKCKCGKCECKLGPNNSERFTGKYCECDNLSCPLKCSGRGTCECGKCVNCGKDWSGDDCGCSLDETRCVMPDSGKLCSGRGRCRCGKCECDKDGKERYSGKFCEECTSCPPQRCDEFKPCVECQAYGTGIYANSSSCLENCTLFRTEIVEKLENRGGKRCRVVVEKDCTMVFEYSYDKDEKLTVSAEKQKICPEPPPLLAIILGVIGSVLLVGIVTLIIWKLVTTVHDKKEYARFMDERNQTKWATDGNPLYKPGTSHFQNPVYNRASRLSRKLEAESEKIE